MEKQTREIDVRINGVPSKAELLVLHDTNQNFTLLSVTVGNQEIVLALPDGELKHYASFV